MNAAALIIDNMGGRGGNCNSINIQDNLVLDVTCHKKSRESGNGFTFKISSIGSVNENLYHAHTHTKRKNHCVLFFS